MSDAWKEDIQGLVGKDIRALVGKDLYCQFRDDTHYRGVIRTVQVTGDGGARFDVQIAGHALCEVMSAAEFGVLLDGDMAMSEADMHGRRDRAARVLPHEDWWMYP